MRIFKLKHDIQSIFLKINQPTVCRVTLGQKVMDISVTIDVNGELSW